MNFHECFESCRVSVETRLGVLRYFAAVLLVATTVSISIQPSAAADGPMDKASEKPLDPTLRAVIDCLKDPVIDVCGLYDADNGGWVRCGYCADAVGVAGGKRGSFEYTFFYDLGFEACQSVCANRLPRGMFKNGVIIL